jgi:cell division transport system permease protein
VVVAIMSFLACVTVGGVSMVVEASRGWQSEVSRELTIQVQPQPGIDPDAEAARAAEIAESSPGVASARALSEEENLQLLEPWLGQGLQSADLPLPRLVVIHVDEPSLVDLDALSQRLEENVRGATLDDHRVWTERLQTVTESTVIIGVAVLALVFTATVLCVVFATRGAMEGNRQIVSVLHFVGAENRFVAAEFERHFLLLGLRGGLAGAAVASVLFLGFGLLMSRWLSSGQGEEISALFGEVAIGPVGYLGAVVIAATIAVLTAITSRMTVGRYLTDMD